MERKGEMRHKRERRGYRGENVKKKIRRETQTKGAGYGEQENSFRAQFGTPWEGGAVGPPVKPLSLMQSCAPCPAQPAASTAQLEGSLWLETHIGLLLQTSSSKRTTQPTPGPVMKKATISVAKP